MTVNERAERKKELRENLTLDEIIDLYLEDEQQIELLQVDNAKLVEELRNRAGVMASLESALEDKNVELQALATGRGRDAELNVRLDSALDVMIVKYLAATGKQII